MQIKAIDHLALTVPDIGDATRFFKQAFGASIAISEGTPLAGPAAETVFGMPKGGRVVARRVLKIGSDVNIELFQYAGMPQRPAAHTYDFGLQHFTVRVADLQRAAYDFIKAGGSLLQTKEYKEMVKNGCSPREGWLYGRTPWETIIEMVTFKEA